MFLICLNTFLLYTIQKHRSIFTSACLSHMQLCLRIIFSKSVCLKFSSSTWLVCCLCATVEYRTLVSTIQLIMNNRRASHLPVDLGTEMEQLLFNPAFVPCLEVLSKCAKPHLESHRCLLYSVLNPSNWTRNNSCRKTELLSIVNPSCPLKILYRQNLFQRSFKTVKRAWCNDSIG